MKDQEHPGVISRRRLLGGTAALAGVVAGGALLEACGPAASSASPRPTGAATQSQAVTRPSELIIGTGSEGDGLDAAYGGTATGLLAQQNLYDPLVLRDKDMNIRPALAESWSAVNPTTWEFKLRQGIKFHNGEEFTAESVKFTFDRVLDPSFKSRQVTFKGSIAGAKVVDRYTVQVQTEFPDTSTLRRLSHFGMVPPKYYAEKGADYVANHPIGTGPYRFVEWVKDDRTALEANPDYFLGRPSIDRVTLKPIPQTTTRMAALQTGQIQLAVNVPPQQVEALKAAGVQVLAAPSARSMMVNLDTAAGPFTDKRVRQALNYAVDVNAIIAKVMFGAAKRIPAMMPAEYSNGGGAPAELKPYPYDPAKARELLAAAGYRKEQTVTFYTPSGRYLQDKEVAQAVAGYLEQVGVKTQVQPMEWAVFFPRFLKRDLLPMYLVGWGLGIFDLADPYRDYTRCDSAKAMWCNQTFDKLVDDGRRQIDAPKQLETYKKATQLMFDEAPMIFLYQQQDLYGATKNVDWQARSDEKIWAFDVRWKP